MPQVLDKCVSEMMADWAKDPSKKPKANKATGKPVKTSADLKSVAFAICQKSLKLHNEQVADMETGGGPALVAVAVTAKPHLRQRGNEISLTTIDGKEVVRVPIFQKSINKHPNGTLIFDDGFIDKMIENHKNKVTDYNVALDFRHDEKMGALAFLDADDGGWLAREGNWLVAYGPPADEEAKKVINSRKWRYASAEFYKNYKSNQLQKLSTETLEKVELEDILSMEDFTMPKQIKVGEYTVNINEDGGVLALGESDVSTLEKVALEFGQGKDALAKVSTLEARVRELEGHTEPELPAEAKVKLEAMQGELAKLQAERDAEKAQRTREQVAVALEKARNYKDANGNAHDPVFLNLIEKGMLLQEFERGEEKISLEAKADAPAIVSYLRKLFTVMLETCPGTMPATGHTEGSEEPLGQKPLPNYSEDELKAALEEFHKNF